MDTKESFVTLDSLRESGCLAQGVSLVSPEGIEFYEVSLDDSSIKPSSTSVIVLKNHSWVGTQDGVSPNEASVVFSGQGDIVGIFKRNAKTFTITRFDKEMNFLSPVKTFNFKEDIQMSALDDLKNSQSAAGAVAKSDALSGAGTGGKLSPEELARRKATREANKALRDRLDAQITQSTQNVDIKSNSLAIENNQAHGTLFGYITGTDSVVKLKIDKKPKLVNGQRVVKPEFINEPSVVDAKAKGKTVQAKFCETEAEFAFKESAPSSVKAIVIGTPAKSNISLNVAEAGQAGQIDDQKDNTLEVEFFPQEAAIAHILWNFGGEISESKATHGDIAGKVYCAETRKFAKDTNKPSVTHRLAVTGRSDKSTRKITRTNYFPIKMYKTVGIGQAAESIALSLENVMTPRAKSVIPALSEITNAAAHNVVNTDGKYSADWTTSGAKVEYEPYDAKKEIAPAQVYPELVKEVNEKSGKVSYKYSYLDVDSVDGPMSKFSAFVAATGLSQEAFKEAIKALGASTKRGGAAASGPKNMADPYAALRVYLVPDLMVNGQAGQSTKLSKYMSELSRINKATKTV